MKKDELPKKGGNFINIIITQAICVALVIGVVFIFKYFFKNDYKEIKGWYNKEVATDTDINEVLK